jgi:hypothetical protein
MDKQGRRMEGEAGGLRKNYVYLPSLRMKVPDHVYVFGSLLLQ